MHAESCHFNHALGAKLDHNSYTIQGPGAGSRVPVFWPRRLYHPDMTHLSGQNIFVPDEQACSQTNNIPFLQFLSWLDISYLDKSVWGR